MSDEQDPTEGKSTEDSINNNQTNDSSAIEAIPVSNELPKELLDKMPPETRRELIMFLSHQRIDWSSTEPHSRENHFGTRH